VGLSIWWKKLSADGRNANEVTSQALTDLGNSATFYDCLVEVERFDRTSRYDLTNSIESWKWVSNPVVSGRASRYDAF
jgi:hypothetical protein